jgi:hypothetical protein
MLIATFHTLTFGQRRTPGVPAEVRIGNGVFQATKSDKCGAIAAFDLDTGEMIYSKLLDSPSGFVFTEEHILVNSVYNNKIQVLDSRLELIDSFGIPLMSDLHSITESASGFLLTSCGTDSVLEIARDGTLLWSWMASEDGYGRSTKGHKVRIRGDRDYRAGRIDTLDQATHPNRAVAALRNGRETVLATLFHQGELIAIDKATRKHEVLLRGMRNPHSIRPCGDGWVVCDTWTGSVVLLDSSFWITELIEGGFNWVQDALPIDDGRKLVIADSNNSRLVIWSVAAGGPVGEVDLPPGWKIHQIEIANPTWEHRLTAAHRPGHDMTVSAKKAAV